MIAVMTTTHLTDDHLTVSFTRTEKISGLVRDQRVPRRAVVAAEVVPDGLAAVRGLRAPGLGLPRLRAVGTWRTRHGKSLVSAHGGRPAVRLTLHGQPWRQMILAVDSPDELAAALSR